MIRNSSNKLIKRISQKGLKKALLSRIDPNQSYRFRFHTFKNRIINGLRYTAVADPYKTIDIRPRKVEARISHYGGEILIPNAVSSGLGQIKAGDWDSPEHKTKVEAIEKVNYFSERFEEGLDLEETSYYQWVYDKQEESGMYKKNGFDSLEKYVRHRLEKYDDLYFDIKEEGYKASHDGENLTPGVTHPIKDRLEVEVSIGRDGSIYLYDGHHRFGIARALDLEIPVHVICRHKKWQEIREDIYKNGLRDQYRHLRDHPDLQDIV